MKIQLLFDVHWQYFWTFLIDLQAKVEFFTVLFMTQNLARLSPVFIFFRLSAGDCLAFRVIGKQPF